MRTSTRPLALVAAAAVAAACIVCSDAQTGPKGGFETPPPPTGASTPGEPGRACPLPEQSPQYLSDTCCGDVFWPGRAHQPCCGNTAYDPTVDSCCQGVLARGYGRLPSHSCCGTVAYNPTHSICCGGRVYDSKAYGCCAGTPYSHCSHICCGCYALTSRHGLGVRAACCGAIVYDSTTQLCCDGSLYDVRGLTAARCCGSQLVHSESYTRCCRGVSYGSNGPFSPLCCPDGTIDFCCNDPVYNVTYCV